MAFSASQLNITAAFNNAAKTFTITDTTSYSGVTFGSIEGTVGVTINTGVNFFPSTQIISTTNGTSAAQASAPWTASKIFLTGTYSFTYTAKLVAMLQSYTIVSNTASSLSIQGDYAAQINNITATAFKYGSTSITLPTSPATYNPTTGLTVVAVTTVLPSIVNQLFNFTVDQSFTRTITQDISYVQPSVCLNWITDLCCSSMTIKDVTVYPENSTIPTRSHVLSYPKGIVPAKADLTSSANPFVISSIWTGTWTDVFTSSFITTFGMSTVSDAIRGVKEHLVSSDEGLCQIYSCITNMANRYAAYLTSAPQRALEMQKYISQASAAYMAYMIGKQCGEADYEQNLTIITDIANSCGCGCDCTDCTNDTPQQVVGCCGTAGTSYNTIVLLSDGSGSMTISSSPTGATETTFTIGVSTVWFSSQFNTLFATKSINALSDVDTTGAPAANQVLYWNNTTQQWTRSKLNLSQLGDVNTTSLADGFILYYDLATTSFKFKANLVTTVSIANCTDVVLTGLANEDILRWNSGTSKWINVANTLDNLFNVDTTGKAVGNSIKWDGTNWIDYAPIETLDGLTNVSITSVAIGDRFRYNGSEWVNQAMPTFTGGYTALGGFTYSVPTFSSFFSSFDPITSKLELGGAISSAAPVLAGTPIAVLTGVVVSTRKLFPIAILTPGGVYLHGIASIESIGQTINIRSHIDATGATALGAPIGTYLFDSISVVLV